MNENLQLKLQALLDGELSEREHRELEAALASDPEARALLTELRHTSAALANFEAETRLPASREFYWSRIQREIQRQEKIPNARPAALPAWRRWLLPAGAFAAVVLAGLLAAGQMGWLPAGRHPTQVETFLADSGAMTYRDEVERTTLVWLSYPAENEFADHDSDDTIQ